MCDLPVVAAVCQAAGEGVTNAFVAGLAWLADAVAGMSAYLFEAFWVMFETTTFVDITSGRFTRVYNQLFGIAVFVMLAFFLLQVIGGMVRREPAALSRAALGLAKSVLGSFVALTLIALALEIVDRLSIALVEATGTTVAQMGNDITLLSGTVAVGATAGPGVAILLTLFLAGLAVGAGFIVWITLLVRKALLLVTIVFAPLALAGASWDATRGWVTRWAQFVLALIVSKLVMVVFFLLAAEQAAAPIEADLASIADPLAGIVLLLVAGFAPYLTYKAISFMGIDFYHAMSTEQEAKQALNRPVPVPPNPFRRAAPKVLNVAADGGGPGGSTLGGRGAVPPPSVRTPGGPTAGAPAAGGGSSASGSGAAGAGAGGAAAAGAGVAAAGAVVAKEAATAGPKLGAVVAGHTGAQTDAAHNSTPGTQQGDRR